MKFPDTYRQTYRHDEASDRFCGFASVPKNYAPCKLIFWHNSYVAWRHLETCVVRCRTACIPAGD